MSLALTLAACASQKQKAEPPLTVVPQAAMEAEAPQTPPPPTAAELLAQQPVEAQAAINGHGKNQGWPVHHTARYVLYPYNEGPDPTVACAPLRTTDIQLQPGETITDVAMGDSERWMATPASSGDPSNATPHLVVKPQAPESRPT